ncbi:hypothetical protein PMZ80_002232 [Knufia obscura]|uniref:Mitochondrial resolvase Ydc2 catalytic domain-containing protein n=2 Tax=Knufia TaxID=430999 RepID=A0AAN8EGZ3_9EURO|nr:hypothetical protein PMZ80_002232 [Knufia obscura]KAK5950592.1 hypothetical protein OHC33_008258 [Knufia fluminis]
MRSPLPSAWSLPTSLKRAQLQQIATLIGAPLSGTKPQLLDGISETAIASQRCLRLKDEYSAAKKKQYELRVMSIDMGIRNLAFAFLTSRVTQAHPKKVTFTTPTLCEWRRVGLRSFDDDQTTEATESADPDPSSSKVDAVLAAESFEPHVMAGHAYAFAKYCASLKPTHILIERQRFRSGGHSAVQEWSLRVGMLEAMLYSTFHTLSKEKMLSNTTIEPMMPMRVNKYWFRDQDIPATGKQAKLAKIAIVSGMLQSLNTSDAAFTAGTDVVNVIDGFGSKLPRASVATKAVKSLNKLDDMSDALLQGLAWLDWQQNRLKLVNDGPESLDVCG